MLRVGWALPLLLTACAAGQPSGTPMNGGGLCRSGSADKFVGQQATPELGKEMLATSGARILRWVPHGGIITMEFSPMRLTVRLTPGNRVESATCG